MKVSGLRLNFVYNIVGVLLPLAVTVITVPYYLHLIGEARYGILSLIWLIFGYFGLFDFGLSRATANRLAQLRNGDPRQRGAVFYTALAMNALLGAFAAIVFYAAALPLLGHFFGRTPELAAEIPAALSWIAALIPLSLIGGVFIGSLEAEERFFTLNLQQVAGSVLLQCLPLAAVLTFGVNIEVAVIGAAAARLFSVCWSAVAALQSMKSSGRLTVRVDLGWSLLKYGGSVTVTNAVGPLLVSADQLLIASLLGAKAVAHYAVPFSIAMKTLIVPGALARVLFPRFSSLQGEAATALADKAIVTLAGVMALICAPAILLADVGLTLWVGPVFAVEARSVAQLLLVGTWVNGIALIPYVLLQGQGRPDIVAKFHIFELIPFIGVLWFCVIAFGLPGAAFAWSLRAAGDAGLLFWATGHNFRRIKVILPGLIVVAAWLIAALFQPAPRVAIPMALLLAGSISAWIVAKDPVARGWIAPIKRHFRLPNKS
jgi:O-antigen/teichoic acid export membrane protein